MRQILFRGKLIERFADATGIRPDLITQGVIKDNFVYGSLVIDNNKCFICTSAHVSNLSYVNNANGTMFEVDSETIGQYTGLTDKNGTKIFEGDIVKLGITYEISYIKKYARFAGRNSSCIFSSLPFDRVRVIGNIHDNPELLEG